MCDLKSFISIEESELIMKEFLLTRGRFYGKGAIVIDH
jgi:hypothetical protein